MPADSADTGSRLVVYGAIAANLFIAATKLTAAFITASSAMTSEGIHSIVDAGNDTLLLLGLHLSKRPPDEAHPLGHGREIYFWGLIVAIVLFGIGGGLSIYEGILHLREPPVLVSPLINYAVLASAAVFETGSFLLGFRELRRDHKGEGFWKAVSTSKDPSVFVVVFEDSAALAGLAVAFLGVFFSHYFDNPLIDGMASIVIGIILAAVAVFLSYQSRALLIGHSASDELIKSVCAIVEKDPAVNQVTMSFSVHLAPHEVALGMDIHFRKGLTGVEVALAVDRLEHSIQQAHHDIRHIFIEADTLAEEGRERHPHFTHA